MRRENDVQYFCCRRAKRCGRYVIYTTRNKRPEWIHIGQANRSTGLLLERTNSWHSVRHNSPLDSISRVRIPLVARCFVVQYHFERCFIHRCLGQLSLPSNQVRQLANCGAWFWWQAKRCDPAWHMIYRDSKDEFNYIHSKLGLFEMTPSQDDSRRRRKYL